MRGEMEMGMMKYRIGIDGGGTHCRGRLVDDKGYCLAEFVGGSANVYTQYQSALDEVEKVVAELFKLANLPCSEYVNSILVAGLAGANVPQVKARLESWKLPGLTHKIVSDVETACIGAHAGNPGAVFICGTGSQGAVWDGESFHLIGGWGFMLSDLASGAELGKNALRMALLAHEGIIPHSSATQQLMSEFKHSAEEMLLWTQRAQPRDWARYAKQIFEFAQHQDGHAQTLVKQCVADAELMIDALMDRCHNELTLLGGMAQPLEEWLPQRIVNRLSVAKGDALDGALYLARHYSFSE